MGGRGGSSGLQSSSSNIEIESANFKPEFLKQMKSTLKDLDSTYENYIVKIINQRGILSGEGGHLSQGGVMSISQQTMDVLIHEFAHGIASNVRDANGLSDNKEFWKEISKIRTRYRKDVYANPSHEISGYATRGGRNGKDNLNEFMAEGFTVAYAKSHGIKLGSDYTTSNGGIKWANEIKSTVDKYFKRRKK